MVGARSTSLAPSISRPLLNPSPLASRMPSIQWWPGQIEFLKIHLFEENPVMLPAKSPDAFGRNMISGA